jgi:hypothetical protein
MTDSESLEGSEWTIEYDYLVLFLKQSSHKIMTDPFELSVVR